LPASVTEPQSPARLYPRLIIFIRISFLCQNRETKNPMKTKSNLVCRTLALALFSAFSLQPSASLHAGTTIDAANRYAYGANLGWMDWSGGTGETATGVVIGEYVCSGYIYSANVGWINLGSGSPADGIYYQNNSANDFGVNQDGLGNLRGYAWGANIGWINFETNGSPRVDLRTGNL